MKLNEYVIFEYSKNDHSLGTLTAAPNTRGSRHRQQQATNLNGWMTSAAHKVLAAV